MSSTGSGYDQSVFTYSPEGRIFQVEYAQKAVEAGGTAVGVRCRDGVILGVEKLVASKMLVEGSGERAAGARRARAPTSWKLDSSAVRFAAAAPRHRVLPLPPPPSVATAASRAPLPPPLLTLPALHHPLRHAGRRTHAVDAHMGLAVAGHLPDGRFLVSQAREAARGYKQSFGEAAPPRVLNDRMGSLMHMTTVYDNYRPFGAALLLAGYDAELKTHELYCIEPTGMALRHFGAALGKGQRAAKTEIEKLKFGERACDAAALNLVAKILYGVHDEAKDKPMELELGWVCAASGWKFEPVPKAMRDAAAAWAKAQIEQEEAGDDDDDEGVAMAGGAAAPAPA